MKFTNTKHIGHSDDTNFEKEVKKLLLFRKIVKAEAFDDQTAVLTLDNGIQVIAHGNEGCGGCGNGWYFIDELNTCDNAITNVKCELDGDDSDGIYHLYVFADNTKINCLQYSGGDNGYYGTGYDLYVKLKTENEKSMTDNEIIKACGEMCTDNRFELIKKYKELLIEGTNIETSANEMAVIDNILFRIWQMGWLNKLEESTRMKKELDRLKKLYELAVAEREANVKGFTETLNSIKSEAIKEFAERLKANVEGDINRVYMLGSGSVGHLCKFKDDIDNLVKEMTEGK